MKILQNTISGISSLLGLTALTWEPYALGYKGDTLRLEPLSQGTVVSFVKLVLLRRRIAKRRT